MIKILFIDDELEIWEHVIQDGLKPFGFEIIGEDNPSRVQKCIDIYKPDAILLDILFHEEYAGKDILGNIKFKHPDLPVMMLTSTMDKTEYQAEEFTLADYRYAKIALCEGNFQDLSNNLKYIIDYSRTINIELFENFLEERFNFIVGRTSAMKAAVQRAFKVADQDQLLLITGESGTGKEVMANAIHFWGKRRQYRFLPFICSALSAGFFTSEIISFAKDSISSITQTHEEKLEATPNDTFFFSEIGELKKEAQIAFLRFLQNRSFNKDTNKKIIPNSRIIATTNRNPENLVKESTLMENLYYELNIIKIEMPSLRDRKIDFSSLYTHFVKRANVVTKKNVLPVLRDDVKRLFEIHDWPGNLREMENLICSAVALSNENILQVTSFEKIYNKIQQRQFNIHSDISSVVNQIFNHKADWHDVSCLFGNGLLQRNVLISIIETWFLKYKQRPSSKELSGLLGISHVNMRRILAKYNIMLTKLKLGNLK